MTGSGTQNDPYIIYDATDLQNTDLNLTAYYELANDINCSGIANFEPIGGWNGTNDFTGHFDGKRRKVFNLVVNRVTDDEVGLFGITDGATISNLRVESTLTGDDRVGGLSGNINGGTVTNCSTNTTLIADTSRGGGFAGDIYGGAVITDCHSEGTVDEGGAPFANYGGFAGWIGTGAVITRCYSTVAVTAQNSDYVGGFAGYSSEATISRSFASGAVDGDTIVGGFIGLGAFGAGVTTTIEDCYATGAVHGVVDACGFCNSNGNSADSTLTMNRCYATGVITCDAGAAPTEVAGFFYDKNAGTVTATGCFWDTESTTVSNSLYGTGKTTAEMKAINTFQEAEWLISTIWNLISSCNNGYPCLIDVNICCVAALSNLVDQSIIGNKVTLEAIRNIEMQYGGRFFVDKSGNAVWQSRYHRNV